MRSDLLLLAVMVGGCTWAFRVLPTRADLSSLPPDGPLSRFLASTGPAAIATLFVASVLPMLSAGLPIPMLVGTVAVVAVFGMTKSVVGATMAGSAAYGAAFWGLG